MTGAAGSTGANLVDGLLGAGHQARARQRLDGSSWQPATYRRRQSAPRGFLASLSDTAAVTRAVSQSAHPRVFSIGQWLRSRTGSTVSIGSFLFVVAIGGAQGGYFPTTWGWCVLAFAWIAGLSLIVRARLEFGRLELAFLASLLLVVGWTALSISWSSDVEQSVLEVQRGLVYLLGVFAALLVVRTGTVPHLLGGLLAGIVWLSTQALASRLFPGSGRGSEEIIVNRLAEPIGYANALGIFIVMGMFLALGFAVHGKGLAGRAAAASALPILLTTAYFTYSRGAALALAAGLIAVVAFDRRRLTLLTSGVIVALPAAAAVWLASRAPGLTSASAPRALVADEGRELAITLIVLAVGAAFIALLVGMIERRVRVPRPARRAYGALLSCAAVVLVAGTVIHHGGPGPLVRSAYQNLNPDLPIRATDPDDLNSRLVSLGNQRIRYYRVALREHERHPWMGTGAGTFEQSWLRHRPTTEQVRDAHSLYLETLAELGWPGLALLGFMLAVPLVGAVRARRHPLAAGVFGAYAAYLVHAGFDWDWEMLVVTLLALACAVALIAAGEDRAASRWRISTGGRVLGLAAVVVVSLFSVVGLVGNRALADSADALDTRDFAAAEAAARTAARWAPWSAEAHQQLGRAQVGLGLREQGRASLLTAANMNPRDWRIWYDLAIASSGRQRQSAFVKAATLNPLETDIEVLRKQGVRLPPRPTPG